MDQLLDHLNAIEEKLGYVFREKKTLVLAFVHRSYYNEHRASCLGHNERLEFLGDSALGLIVSGYLFERQPSGSEGHLSHLRAHFVGADSCAQFMHALQLEQHLLLGKGESVNIGRGRERILADLFEAIIGAIYVDGGLKAAENFFIKKFSPFLDGAMEKPLRNWKAELQDISQKKFQRPPEYQILQEEGPPHQKIFLVAVYLDGTEKGQGEGPSKKQAEQAAAEEAIRRMEKDGQN